MQMLAHTFLEYQSTSQRELSGSELENQSLIPFDRDNRSRAQHPGLEQSDDSTSFYFRPFGECASNSPPQLWRILGPEQSVVTMPAYLTAAQ